MKTVMDKVRQENNIVSVTHIAIYPYVDCSSDAKTATIGIETAYSPEIKSKKRPCYLIFFIPPYEPTYYCEELTDVDDIIAKYTSTEKGRKAFAKAEEELHKELYQQALEGKLNRVKYFRLINNMDQKTLAKLSGIKQPNISRIEKSGYIADTDTYKKIAKIFKIDYKELLP